MVVYLNATALLSGLELTVTQRRTAQAHLIPGPAEWTLWILSNFTHSAVLLHHLFFSIHRCTVNLRQLCFSFITSLSVLVLLLSLPVSHSPFFLCDAVMQLLFVLKLLKLHNRQFLAVIHLSFVFQFLGFFLFFYTSSTSSAWLQLGLIGRISAECYQEFSVFLPHREQTS